MLTSVFHRRKGFSLVAALALSWSAIALAAPAVVKKDTDARSAPFPIAPLIETLHAGVGISADETPTNGWRRIQLSSGKFAFVHDGDIEMGLPHATPARPAPPSTPSPASRPVEPLAPVRSGGGAPLYVGDFAHLAELVKSDSQAFDLANTFDTEQTVSSLSIWGGVFGGLLLWVLADTALKHEKCVGEACANETNVTAHNIGTAILVLGPLLGWAIRPTRSDQTRVIDEWNSRHADRPFIDHAGVEAPQ
jgi:hypothetical protein